MYEIGVYVYVCVYVYIMFFVLFCWIPTYTGHVEANLIHSICLRQANVTLFEMFCGSYDGLHSVIYERCTKEHGDSAKDLYKSVLLEVKKTNL